MSIMEWFFTETIYGIIAIIAVIYLPIKALNKKFTKTPDAEFIAGILFFILILTVPSYPRFKFERETRAMLVEHKHMKIINETKWGDLIEPITWFHAPVGAFNVISPEPFVHSTEGFQAFKQIFFRYEEEPSLYLIEVNCKEKVHNTSEMQTNGKFHVISTENALSDSEYNTFCNTDWSEQLHAAKNFPKPGFGATNDR